MDQLAKRLISIYYNISKAQPWYNIILAQIECVDQIPVANSPTFLVTSLLHSLEQPLLATTRTPIQ